jgi:diphthine synthase
VPLALVGLGIGGARGLSLAALEAIRRADKVYLETYTSPVSDELVEEVARVVGRDVTRVGRVFVEDGRQILEESREGHVVLISLGDPLIATTHNDLRVRAAAQNIEVKVFHNASILTVAYGGLGLHPYRFGRMVTLTSGSMPPITAYSVILSNLLQSLHTLILLEYVEERRYALTPREGVDRLRAAEQSVGAGIINDELFVIVGARLGSEAARVWLGRLGDIDGIEFGEPPHCMVVPSNLHFTEEESLRRLFRLEGSPDNTRFAKPLAKRMLERYIPKTREALAKARAKGVRHAVNLSALFENVECYVDDAERFLGEGRAELALLSMGYAEGLLDSLRLLGILEVEW